MAYFIRQTRLDKVPISIGTRAGKKTCLLENEERLCKIRSPDITITIPEIIIRKEIKKWN